MSEICLEGGCYCGAIRYQARCLPHHQTTCYCGNCRRAIGAQSVAWVTFAADRFEFTSGAPARYRTDTGAWRTFCATCGSSLTYQSDDRMQDMDVVTASLDDPERFPPNKGVFDDERLSWDH